MFLYCLQVLNSTNCCTKFRLYHISGFPNIANAKFGPLVLRDSENIFYMPQKIFTNQKYFL